MIQDTLSKKLNKYIIAIIDEYLNYSLEKIIGEFDSSNLFTYILKPNITIREIFILCIKTGFTGFYLHPLIHCEFIKQIKVMIENDEYLKKNIDSGVNDQNNYVFYIKNLYMKTKIGTIPLNRIDCWDKVKL